MERAVSVDSTPSKMAKDHNQVSFTSVSSSESGLDITNSSYQDMPDAVPRRQLRIRRMPLFEDNYVQQRKASVENLLASRTPDQSTSRKSVTQGEEDPQQVESSSLRPSNSCDFKKEQFDPDPYSYLKTECGNFSSCENNQDVTAHEGNDLREHSTVPPLTSFQSRFRHASDSGRYSAPLLEEDCDCLDGEEDASDDVWKDDQQNTQACPGANNFLREKWDVTDSFPSRPERPILPEKLKEESERGENEAEKKEPYQTTPFCTPPKGQRNSTRARSREDESGNCCGSCCLTVGSLFKLENLCDGFSIVDICLTVFSIGIFIFDIVTDLLLSLSYYRKIDEHEDYKIFFGLTLGLVIVPSMIMQIFSFWWVVDDFRHKRSAMKKHLVNINGCYECFKLFYSLILHILQLAPLLRYFRAMHYGVKSRYYDVTNKEVKKKHFETLWKYEMHDINMLRLLESFLESAPQLVLQIYIMLMTKKMPLLTVISCLASLIALSTMIVSLQRAIRQSDPDKKQLSIPASAVMFCWRACTISSRVLAFALVLTYQPLVVLILVLLHWFASTVWIVSLGTDFCSGKCAEYLFNVVCGLIYVFCYLNLSENKAKTRMRTPCRMALFYAVVFLENLVLSLLWFFYRPGGGITDLSQWKKYLSGIWQSPPDLGVQTVTPVSTPTDDPGVIKDGMALGLVTGVIGFFILGLVFMVVYYLLLHPKHDTFSCIKKKTSKNPFEIVSAPANGSGDHIGVNFKGVSDNGESPIREVAVRRLKSGTPHRGALQEAKENFGSEECTELLGTEDRSPHKTIERVKGSSLSLQDEEENQENTETSQGALRTAFNRGKRARKLYTKQYSIEKGLEGEERGEVEQSVLPHDSRQTDRFKATVTPTREKKVLEKPIDKSDNKLPPRTRSTNPSVVIKPGTRQASFQGGNAPRSATHLGALNTYNASPIKTAKPMVPPVAYHTSPIRHSKPHQNSPRVPPSVQSRDYSASMSCLMGRPLSYVARREMALRENVPRTPSFTVAKNEVIESIESSV